MRALVTGASGFVGQHLCDALRRERVEFLACGGPHDRAGEYVPLDVRDENAIRAALDAIAPTVVFHLAAQAFVPESISETIATYEINAIGSARLARAVRGYAAAGSPMPRVLFVSSGEVYGDRAGDLPLRETLDLRPANPYAASKAAAEAILLAEARSLGLDVVVARSFNHIGPGQNERFVVPSLALQLARIAAGGPPHLLTGNLAAARDFLDVADVVRAYLALARDGDSGEVYNVCSGNAVSIRDILRELILIARVPVEVREDPTRMRPSDVDVSVGSPQKLQARTGWRAQVPLRHSLASVYERALTGARHGDE